MIARNVDRREVVGAGGRLRYVSICEAGCWHGNDTQAHRCLEGLGEAAYRAFKDPELVYDRPANDRAAAVVKAERAARKARKVKSA